MDNPQYIQKDNIKTPQSFADFGEKGATEDSLFVLHLHPDRAIYLHSAPEATKRESPEITARLPTGRN